MKKLKLKLLAITVAIATMIASVPSIKASATWKQDQGKWYYLNNSGEKKTGWVNDSGRWYYLNNSGEMRTGWVNDNGVWYYLSNAGEMKTGWANDNGTWYCLNNSGAMKTGWVKDNDRWYYLSNSGSMKTGWINDNNTWYFSDISGAMQTGVVKVDGKTYYLNEATGAMQVGNAIINGKVYTFAQTGEAIGTDLAPVKAFNLNGAKITENNNSNNTTKTNEETTSNNSSNSGNSSSGNNGNTGGSGNTGNTGGNGGTGGNGNTGNNGGNGNTGENGGGDVGEGISTNYLEDYRQQYHYSPAKAWANDPNGMVYFNGEWHLFYQYYPDDSVWGPMHWGHAVSKDLIHWEELPIALYPDEGGTIFSGSAVIDKDNTTGFFDGIEGGGLVAIYTQDYIKENGENRQKQSIAYSKDNGRTWTKYEGNPVIAAEDDPLNNWAFRDPKVFYNEEAQKWMMVVAGGPLRFFSSDNLKDWKPEAMQPEIETECPDIYKLEIGDTGQYKWVLSGGGRLYWIGDFREVDGEWTFVPDDINEDGFLNQQDGIVMNFAKDSYAAQTYYGTGENGTPDGRRIMINWMNNWDYCNNVAQITKTFNGSFNLQHELKLVNTSKGVRMIQQPIDEYETLRKSPITFDNITISPDQPNIMKDLSGSKYEIVAEFTPDENATEVGFKLRVGESANQETIVKYNIATGELVLDRSKSGKTPSADKFLQAYSQKMSKTSDGKIQLHIFVDAASVEVFGNDGEVTGAAQIFPNRSSNGIEVYSVGGSSVATIKYYPLSSIWNNEVEGTDSVLVSLSEGDLGKKVGDEFSIYTATVPQTAAQGVAWEFNHDVLEILTQDNEKTTFRTKSVGSTTLTAVSKDNKSRKTINVSVYDSNPSSIIGDLTNFATNGDWYVKEGSYVGNSSGDGFAVAEQTNESGMSSVLEADADVSNGNTAGVVLLSQTANPKEGSIIANVNKNGEYRVFAFTETDGNVTVRDLNSGIVPKTGDSIYKLKAEVNGSHIKYWINDELVCDTNQSYFETGRFGLNVFGGATSFKNVTLNKNTPSTETSISGSDLTFDNTPLDLHVSDDSYVVDGGKNSNGFAISDQTIDTEENTYTLELDSKMLGDWHNQNPANGDVAGIVLFAQGDNYFRDGGIIANVGKWGHYRLFGQVPDGNGGMREVEFAVGDVPEAKYNRYHLKIELNGNHIIYSINGTKVCDITQDYYTTGKFGLNVWNGASEFRNIVLTESAVAPVVNPMEIATTGTGTEQASGTETTGTGTGIEQASGTETTETGTGTEQTSGTETTETGAGTEQALGTETTETGTDAEQGSGAGTTETGADTGQTPGAEITETGSDTNQV